MSTINAEERLILALDVPSLRDAEKLLDRVGDGVQMVKVGLELFTAAGPGVVERLQERGKRVFLDLKFLDIEETVRRATAQVAGMGIDFLTVHANRKALAAAVEARDGSSGPRLKLLAVTVLTNQDARDVEDMGVRSTISDLVTARAKMAVEVGCDGVIASGEEPLAIRKMVGKDLLIVTPGIRPVEKDRDDHARATTPTQAIRAGSDYLVVGRPIRDANDPKAATEAIIAEMQAAFDSRKN